MGRRKIQLDPNKIKDLTAKGMTQVEIANELGVSHVTLARRIAELRIKEGVLVDYRSIQALQLTALQVRVLEAITPEKIAKASLLELAKAAYLLKKAEVAINPPQLKEGLQYYLMQLEKLESKMNSKGYNKKFIDNKEFMKLMGISPRTAQNWRDRGVIPFSQIGNKIYYLLEDIEFLLYTNRYEAFGQMFNNEKTISHEK